MIEVKRVYEPFKRADGKRFLVERLWPRGIKKEELPIAGWVKDVAPSPELRQWYSHDVEKWPGFRRRYNAELDRNPEAWQPLLRAARRGTITLVYSARDPKHNSAIVLQAYLKRKLEA